MKIGIDVHSIGSRKGGNETFYREFVKSLGQISTIDDFILYYTVPGTPDQLSLPRNFKFRKLVPRNPLVRIPLVLPRSAYNDRLDVLHLQYIVPPFVKCKTIVSIFDLAHERYPGFFNPIEAVRSRALVRSSAKRADHILTVSKFSARDLVKIYHVPPEKITVAYLAASEQFRPLDRAYTREIIERRYSITSNFILYAGRLQARKNLVRLVEAYADLRKRGVEEKLVLVGGDDWRVTEIYTRVRDLSLESDVRLLGYVPIEDLVALYNSARIFVYPSIFEGFGLPVVESMACGTPTITSYGSSLEEVAGDAALLVDPLSTTSITNALERLLNDECLRNSLGQRGLARSAQFNYRNLGESALSVYELVAGQNHHNTGSEAHSAESLQ